MRRLALIAILALAAIAAAFWFTRPKPIPVMLKEVAAGKVEATLANTRAGTIDTMPDIPGLAVWHDGHIGVYIGGGQVVEAMGTKYGVVKTELAGRGWTHWLKIPYINYD